MKSLIVLVLGLLAVGCLTPEQKQKRLRDSMVGEYEYKDEDGDTLKWVFLDNGVSECYIDGKKEECKWSIANGRLYVEYDASGDKMNEKGWSRWVTQVYRINKDRSITGIVRIRDRKRWNLSKAQQNTWKKIK